MVASNFFHEWPRGDFIAVILVNTAADRIDAPSKHFTLTVGNRDLVAQNVILIVQINKHMMTVILRYCAPFYEAPMHTFVFTEVMALVLELATMARSWRD